MNNTDTTYQGNIISSLKNYLQQGLGNEALDIVKSINWSKCDFSTELIPIITKYFDPTFEHENPVLIASCEDILCEIAKYANPDDIFFGLLEKLDGNACDIMIISLLQPFDIVLQRLSTAKVQSLRWFYTSLIDNLKEIDVFDDERLLNVFNKVNAFTTKYINELNLCNDNDSSQDLFFAGKKEKGQEVITNFLLNGLALLAPLDAHPLLITVIKSLGDTLPSLDIPLLQFMKKRDADSKADVPDFAYEVLYYMIFCQGVEYDKFPVVYSQEFIFECTIALSCGLMSYDDNAMHKKGLSLLASVVQHVFPHSISHNILSSPHHRRLFLALSKVMVFHPNKEVRQEAVPLLRKYIASFDPKGRHLFISHAINASDQQGVTAYLITLIKEFSLDYINKNEQNYFRTNLPKLICVACHVPKVKNIALFDASDQVITALSLIRFLYIKDPKPGHLGTGIWKLEFKLKTNFLVPLTEMLDKSRDSLKQQLSDAQCLENTTPAKRNSQLSVTVQGSLLPVPKYEEEIASLKAKLNTLDLIQMRLDIAKEGWGI